MEGSAVHRSRYPDPVVPEQALPAYVLEHAARWPDRPALVDGSDGATLTYRQLVRAVGAVAMRLSGAGVVPGDAVALWAPNQPSWAAAFYGTLAAGAAAVPLNALLTTAEARSLVAASGARVLVTGGPVGGPGTGPIGRTAEAGLPPDWPVTTLSLDALTVPAAPTGGPEDEAGPCPPPSSGGDATAVVAFSSGTTGLPKGVRLTHRNLVATLVQHEPIYRVGPGDVVVGALPFCHIYGLSMILGYALRHGATVVTMPRFDLARYLALVAEHRATWLHLVPPLALALTSPAAAGADLSSVRHAVSGAAPLDPALAARTAAALGCSLGQGYGMTEASPGVTWVPDDGSVDCPPGSVGVLVPGTEARVVDPGSGEDTDGPGELWVRGPQVMAGYLGEPAGTDALTADGWLRTGDVVRVDEHGVFWVVDRLKELIKYKGWQVAPAELEAVLRDHPAVADAAVAGLPDPEAGELPVAWVEACGPVEPAELVAWVADRVAPYKKVRRVQLVERIPRSPSGKVLRRQLVTELTGAGDNGLD